MNQLQTIQYKKFERKLIPHERRFFRSGISNISIIARLKGLISKEELGDIVEIMENWIFILREELTRDNISNIEAINSIKKDLESTNVNKRLALENLVLQLK